MRRRIGIDRMGNGEKVWGKVRGGAQAKNEFGEL